MKESTQMSPWKEEKAEWVELIAPYSEEMLRTRMPTLQEQQELFDREERKRKKETGNKKVVSGYVAVAFAESQKDDQEPGKMERTRKLELGKSKTQEKKKTERAGAVAAWQIRNE